MKRGVPYLRAVKEGMREGKTNAEARKIRTYNQKSGETTSIDLAPMVDIAFLLLTFFIMTTSFSKPKVFGMGLPQEGSSKRGGSGAKPLVVTLKVIKGGSIFIVRDEDKKESSPEKVELASLKSRMSDIKSSTSKLTLVVKFSDKLKFGLAVDVLDEVYKAGVTKWAALTLKPEEESALQQKVKEET